MDNQNVFRDDNGNKIHVIPNEEEEDEFTIEELRNVNAMKDKLCKEWMLCNEWIGNFVSSNQNEYYARNFIEMGYDSVESIENDFVFLFNYYMDVLNFMDPLYREVFIENISKEFQCRDDLKRQHEASKVRYQNAIRNMCRCVPRSVLRRQKVRKHHLHLCDNTKPKLQLIDQFCDDDENNDDKMQNVTYLLVFD